MNLSACGDGSTDTERQQNKAKHSTHRGPAPLQITLLTVDLPHHGKPYSLWTCPTASSCRDEKRYESANNICVKL